MAGVVPTKRSASGRKQWTLHGRPPLCLGLSDTPFPPVQTSVTNVPIVPDNYQPFKPPSLLNADGPESSLKRLRSQLANDGCAESQVVLAKQLLDDQCDIDGSEQHENDLLGVYWLIKSSEQGNEEATELLKKCLANGRGITEQNYMDVKSCINMTQDEKLAREAARKMFASLSNGEDYITSCQLQKRMLEIDKGGPHRSELTRGTETHNGRLFDYEEVCPSGDCVSNEKLTEDHVVAAAVDYSHGHLPLVNAMLCLTLPNPNALDHINYIHRSILHPLLVLKILYFKLIKWLGSRNFVEFLSARYGGYHVAVLMLAYTFFGDGTVGILNFVPNLVYYGSFLIMIMTTFQMLLTKRNYSDFRVWSALFLTYSGGSLNANEVEYQFIRNNLRPYAYFFVSLLLHVLFYPLVSEQWLPQSELTIISFCLTFMSLHGFMIKDETGRFPDVMVLLSFAVNVLAKYPYDNDPVVTQGWRFLDLDIPTFASYVIGNGIEFCLNFRIVFYLMIPVLFANIASRQNWRGTYRNLIPHCVTLGWLQMIIINSRGATMYGLLRGTLALVGVVMFLPLVGLTSIILPAVAVTKWLANSFSLYSAFVFTLSSVLCLSIGWLLTKTVRYARILAFLQICLGTITFFVLVDTQLNVFSDQSNTQDYRGLAHEVKTLSWEQFYAFCQEPAWETDGTVATQQRCSRLHKLRVEWEGFVNEVNIWSVDNSWKRLAEKLPNFMSRYLACALGEPARKDSMLFEDLVTSREDCTLDAYDVYTFKITVRKNMGVWSKLIVIDLVASDEFKNFTLNLRPNDAVRFVGQLDSPNGAYGIGHTSPRLILQEIECVECQDSKLKGYKLKPRKSVDIKAIYGWLRIGCRLIADLLFYPIIVFK